MSARARRPTDEIATQIFDPEQEPTEVTPIPMRGPSDLATPADIASAPGGAVPAAESASSGVPAAPIEHKRFERSEPIRVISMKGHTDARKPRVDDPRVPLHIQLRSLAEVAGRSNTPVELGRLAPPHDARRARARHMRANLIWACIAVALACASSLSIWLVAGR